MGVSGRCPWSATGPSDKTWSIRVEDGPGFAGRPHDPWADLNEAELDFSRLGKRTDTAFSEASDSRLRQECRNVPWLLSMADARARITDGRIDDNAARPHSVLGNLARRTFAVPLKPARKFA